MPYPLVFFQRVKVTPHYWKRERCSSVVNVCLHTERGGFVRTCGMGFRVKL